MKNEKTAKPAGVMLETLKTAGEAEVGMTTDLVNQIIVGSIIAEWEFSKIGNC